MQMTVCKRIAYAVVTMLTFAGCGLVGGQSSSPPRARPVGPSPTTRAAAPAQAPRLLITATGVTVPIIGGSEASGWRVTTPCGRPGTTRGGTVIGAVDVVIDPGHGGPETGAVAFDMRESQLNLDVARMLQGELSAMGIRSALTRTGDYQLPIATRAAIINAVKPKVFVSLQHNGGPAADRATPGTELYYQRTSPRSKRLAGVLWQDITARLKQFPAHWVGASDAGAIYRTGEGGADYYGILRMTRPIPGVLIEASYMTEPSQGALLAGRPFRGAEAAGLATGIRRYLTTADPGGGYQVPLQRSYDDAGGRTAASCRDPLLAPT